MKTTKTTKRARKTVTVPASIDVNPSPAPIVFQSMSDLLAAFRSFVGTPAPTASQVPVPVAAEAPIVPIVARTHKTYGLAKNPRPPFGTVTMQVFDHLAKHGFKTQRELEAETGLSEGQIKGSIRQLTLAGYIVNGTDRS